MSTTFSILAFGIFLLPLVSTQTTDSTGTTTEEPKICPNSPFEEWYVKEYVVHHINDQRYALLKGLIINGPWNGKGYGKKLPLPKTMNRMVWSCDIEKEARAALNNTCSYTEPNAPAGKTGIFYSMDIDWDEPELMSAVWSWTDEIKEFPISDHAITDAGVKYNDLVIRQYLNLMRPPIKEIGCADVMCRENGLNKYRAFCLIDVPPLKINDVLYEAGQGGCDKGEQCPSGRKCGRSGLCDAAP